MRTRDKTLTIRLTEKEKSVLDRRVKKSGLDRSKFLRSIISEYEIKSYPPDRYNDLFHDTCEVKLKTDEIYKKVAETRTLSNEDLNYLYEMLKNLLEKARNLK